jgi:hypothetical protein
VGHDWTSEMTRTEDEAGDRVGIGKVGCGNGKPQLSPVGSRLTAVSRGPGTAA